MTILIFGATGSAGGSVLSACLVDPAVTEIRAVTRRPLGIAHDKLRVYTHDDFLNYAAIADTFAGVDACLFCLGTSVTQVEGEEEYRRITRDFAVAAAEALRAGSPSAPFHYLSGAGAGVGSRFMWARVKAEAERELIDRFDALCWRPAAIDGAVSDRAPWQYKLIMPFLRLLKPFRNLYITGEDLGRAMIQATKEKLRGCVLENVKIREIADRRRVALGA